MADTFRWQALFQKSSEPIFVLDRRRRLIFANRAWEVLTGASFSDARGMTCTPRQSRSDLGPLSRTLAPPPEVAAGRAAIVCRPLPHARTGPPWWMIDFLPLADDDKSVAVIGRITASKVGRAGGAKPLSGAQMAVRNQAAERWRLGEWDGPFPSLSAALNQARLAASVHTPVLIVGERGVGKHWLARAIHHAGDAAERPFVALDAAALSAAAVTGVLFGPLGIYRTDGAGTIYIREPARLTLEVQDELAQRVGDTGPRLIAGAESLDALDQSRRDGSLLPALSDVLTVLTIRIPPVRERSAEMAAIVTSLFARETGAPELNEGAVACLKAYSWPGNLVEVQVALNLARRDANGSPIEPAHLPLAIRQSLVAAELRPPPEETMPALDSTLEDVERQMIRAALKKAGGNQTRAAELLSIWRPRLIRRMKALGINDPGQ